MASLCLGVLCPGLTDLPPFLRQMVDSVRQYAQWCEEMLGASYPLKISSKINDNLQRQMCILQDQTKSVEEQVHLYRVSHGGACLVVL